MRPVPHALDESVFFRLVQVVNRTARPFFETVGRPHDLSLNEWRVLLVLGHEGQCTASDICSISGMDKMTVSRAVARLSRSQRIQRNASPQDRRSQWLSLTPGGKALFEELAPLGLQREAQLLSVLSTAQRTQLMALLDAILANPQL
jgi:DNA-binding MarR family transcriptional regulator